jgi:hypothetical protein
MVVVVARHMLLIREFLLDWIQWLPTISKMFCNLALDDLKLLSIDVGVTHMTRSVQDIFG